MISRGRQCSLGSEGHVGLGWHAGGEDIPERRVIAAKAGDPGRA